jgi:restriction endonuclease S subunit
MEKIGRSVVTPAPLAFCLPRSRIQANVFLPKYYDPEVERALAVLRNTHDLITLGSLVDQGSIHVTSGHEIGKMAYGTGRIPFVRTSDVSNWEIKTDPKQGISDYVYQQFASAQDVQAGDILFVRDGTYLVGQVAVVTEADLPMLFQSHLLKFRVESNSPVSALLLLALLSTPIVRQQIKMKKFTADIIDTIGDRYREIILPIPKDRKRRLAYENSIKKILSGRAALRSKIKKIPFWLEGYISSSNDVVPIASDDDVLELGGSLGFLRAKEKIQNGIFIPKYYAPELDRALKRLSRTHELIRLSDLVADGVISWSTGIEIGKMAYGTGDIPFVRTSDISNWELKGDPKQNVSGEIYTKNKQDVQAGDIFVVRDGTYLVGTSCILTDVDTKILFCGGLYKFRVENKKKMNPYLLLAALNAPIVKRQMRSKQFTRDIIDTLGHRIFEIILPLPKSIATRKAIARETALAVDQRVDLRQKSKLLPIELEQK